MPPLAIDCIANGGIFSILLSFYHTIHPKGIPHCVGFSLDEFSVEDTPRCVIVYLIFFLTSRHKYTLEFA